MLVARAERKNTSPSCTMTSPKKTSWLPTIARTSVGVPATVYATTAVRARPMHIHA